MVPIRELIRRRVGLGTRRPGSDPTGRCNVCGNAAVFEIRNPDNLRESLVCSECGTTSRYRSLARGILRALKEIARVEAASLAELPARFDGPPVRIYDTQVAFRAGPASYPLPELLARCDWIEVVTSMYRSGEQRGSLLGRNCTNQTLEQLTFPDDHFQVVVTSDVLEHVRLAEAAHREIARVLAPGGVHVFTVPHTRTQRATIERVAVHDPADPSRDEHLMEPEYHGDPNDADDQALVYRIYGTDLDQFLSALGFSVDYSRSDHPSVGILETELFYCRLTASGAR